MKNEVSIKSCTKVVKLSKSLVKSNDKEAIHIIDSKFLRDIKQKSLLDMYLIKPLYWPVKKYIHIVMGAETNIIQSNSDGTLNIQKDNFQAIGIKVKSKHITINLR